MNKNKMNVIIATNEKITDYYLYKKDYMIIYQGEVEGYGRIEILAPRNMATFGTSVGALIEIENELETTLCYKYNQLAEIFDNED